MSHRGMVGMLAAAMAAIVVVSVLHAEPERGKIPPPRDVTLTGKIVDLHSFITGKFKSSDQRRRTRDSIRAGVPAALLTDDGIVIIGEGFKGPQRTITPLAFKFVELKGKLYVHEGLHYIDITSAKVAKLHPESGEQEPWTPDPDEPEVDDPLPEPDDTGACCLSSGDCADTDVDTCDENGGIFYEGESCAEIDCEQ